MTRSSSLVLTLLTGALLGGCAEKAPEAAEATEVVAETVERASYTDISVAELQTMLASKDFPLVNVHVPFDGDLPSTDASIPYDQIAAHLDQLPADKNAKIVLYCRSGSMSVEAARTLADLGYTNVYNLVGGFNAWRDAGLPMAGR